MIITMFVFFLIVFTNNICNGGFFFFFGCWGREGVVDEGPVWEEIRDGSIYIATKSGEGRKEEGITQLIELT